jgi:hypothetical protein
VGGSTQITSSWRAIDRTGWLYVTDWQHLSRGPIGWDNRRYTLSERSGRGTMPPWDNLWSHRQCPWGKSSDDPDPNWQEASTVTTRAQAKKSSTLNPLRICKELRGSAVNRNDLSRLQKEDPSLEKYRSQTDPRKVYDGEVSFEEKNGILFRVWFRCKWWTDDPPSGGAATTSTASHEHCSQFHSRGSPIDILYTLDSASLLVKLKPRIFQR